ncbi:MAG: hypothetical protein Q4D90_00995 [bacterium]|nr:hypothetical protein [bacterium]
MKFGRKRILGIVLGICLMLSGCESILLDADLDKSQVEAYRPTVTYVKEEDMDKMVTVTDSQKYEIEGTEAFYILPPHQPAPDKLLDFQLLDFVDGTTSIYAYQALCETEDPLGGEAAAGRAKEGHKDSLTQPATGDQMATILMSYNTVTKEYQVFFSQIGEVTLLESEGSQTPVASEATMFANKAGRNQDEYFLYYEEQAYVYNKSGELLYDRDISDVLSLNATKYGGTGAEVTVQDVVMDANYFVYLSVSIEKAGEEISEDTSEEDLKDEDGSSVLQMLYSCFYFNVGNDEEKYFISRNTNYEEQVRLWRDEVDGKTFDFGTEISTWQVEMWKQKDFWGDEVWDFMGLAELKETIPTMKTIEEEYPTTNSVYQYADDSLPIQLYTYIYIRNLNYGWKFWLYDISQHLRELTPSRYQELTKGGDGEIRLNTNGSDLGLFAGIPVEGNEEQLGEIMVFPENVRIQQQEEHKETLKRTYTISWEERLGNGETQSREETIEEEVDVLSHYTMRLPEDTWIQWSEARYTTDMINSSSGTGVIRFGSEGDGDDDENATSTIRWEQGNSKFHVNNIPGKARNAETLDNTLILATTKGLALFQDYVMSQNGFFVPNQNWSSSQGKMLYYKDLNFGASVGEGESEKINEYQTSIGSLLEGESTYDGEISVSENDSADNYKKYSFLYQDGFLYIAGVYNGLVKYNLNASGSSAKAGQLSPYPTYGIWKHPTEADSCYVIGYPSTEYTYQDTDISRAKVYKLSLTDDTACSNLISSALEKNPKIQEKVKSGDASAWNALQNALGIASLHSESVEQYWDTLQTRNKEINEAVRDFFDLIQLESSQRTEDKRELIENCYYISELETNMETMTEKTVKELREQSGLKQEEWDAKLESILQRLLGEEETESESSS